MSKNPKEAKPAEPPAKAPPAAAAQGNQKVDPKKAAATSTPVPAGKQPPPGPGQQGKDQPVKKDGKDQPGKKDTKDQQKSQPAIQKPPESPKIDPMKEERKRQKKLMVQMQKQYFDDLWKQLGQGDPSEEGKKTIIKVDKKNVKKLEYGILQLEGILHRKGNMIEEDQVDSQLLEVLKEKDQLVSSLSVFQQYIKDYESQLTADAQNKRVNIVEEEVIKKRISEIRKQRDETEKDLLQVEIKIKLLQSQRIDNPRSAYSHPGLKVYLDSQEITKKRDASIFVKKLLEEKKIFDEKKKKFDQISQAKQIQEDQDKLAKEARLKIQKEKEKEENLKMRIREIEEEKSKRQQEFTEHQEKYKQQTEKMNNGKAPLYMRLSKQFLQQQKEAEKNLDENRENHKRIDEMNLFDHQSKYLEKLKAQEEERQQDAKRHKAELKENFMKISALPQSQLYNFGQEESQANPALEMKQRAMKIVEARSVFAEGVKTKKKVNVDEEKRLEMQVKIDKLNNPGKYIKQLKKRRNSAESREASEEYDKFDEKVFKNEIKIERKNNQQNEKGLEYLEEIKEAVKKMPKKARSEQPLPGIEKTIDNLSEMKAGSIMSHAMSTAKPKIDYLAEMRSKYQLDKKTEGLKDWERVSRSYNGMDIMEKKSNLLRISKKLDDEARHKELMFNINKSNKKGKFSVQDVVDKEKIDDMYVESIKAKLAIFDQVQSNNETQRNLDQSEDYQDNNMSQR